MQYLRRDRPGQTPYSTDIYNNGLSIRKLVYDVAGLPTVTAVEVQRPFGGVTRLDADDLTAPGSPGFPFVQGQTPDLALPNDADPDHNIIFVRPLRAGDDRDVNKDDIYFQAVVRITAYTSGHRTLRPSVAPATTTTKVDAAPTAFGVASYAGPQPAGAVSYAWDFGDGTTSTEAAPNHTWTRSGSYEVTVTVTDSQDSVGRGYAEVTVGKKPKPAPADTDTPGGGKGPGTEHGATDGRGTDEGRDPDSTGGTGASRPGKATRPSADAGTRVSGILIDAERAVAVTVPAPASAPVAAAPVRRATKIPTDWRWLLGLLPVVLLGAGVVRQTPWLSRRLPEPPWRRV